MFVVASHWADMIYKDKTSLLSWKLGILASRKWTPDDKTSFPTWLFSKAKKLCLQSICTGYGIICIPLPGVVPGPLGTGGMLFRSDRNCESESTMGFQRSTVRVTHKNDPLALAWAVIGSGGCASVTSMPIRHSSPPCRAVAAHSSRICFILTGEMLVVESKSQTVPP